MHRVKSRALLLGGLVGLLAACGEVPGGAAGISGTVTAPAGGSVVDTDVFACFTNEADCERLSLVTVQRTGTSADYRLISLPNGSYGVYGFKDVDDSGGASNGDLYGYYSTTPGVIGSVRPPASGIDIEMSRLTGATPAPVRESLTKIISD